LPKATVPSDWPFKNSSPPVLSAWAQAAARFQAALAVAAPAAQDTGDAVFSDDDSCSFQIKRANQTTARQHMPLYTNSPQIS